jgi:hypothetical protein
MFVVAAPVQCPDLLAAAPRNRRLELERADRCLSRKGDGSRVRIGLAGGELVEKARIVARVVDDVGAEGREFAVERHRRLRNEVSTPDHAKALVRISRGSGMRQERRALDAVPRRAPTCDPVGTAPLAAHDRM